MSQQSKTTITSDVRYAPPCPTLHERLKEGAAILELIDRKRLETGIASLGQNIERMVIDRGLANLSKHFLGRSDRKAYLAFGQQRQRARAVVDGRIELTAPRKPKQR